MLFSLILPVYGVEKYIAKCVESCCSQAGIQYSDYEIIIVDDSTPDASLSIAEEVLKKYVGINYRIIKRPNGGLSAARNTGLEVATGEFVWFIDSDDWVEENSLEILKQTITINPDVEIITFSHQCVYPNQINPCWIPESLVANMVEGIEVVKLSNFYAAWNRIYKRRLFSDYAIRFKEGILWEDGELNLRLLPLIKKHLGIKPILYNYLRREGSISTSNKVKKTLDSDLIKYESVNEWFKKHQLSTDDRKILNFRNNEAIIFYLAGIPCLDEKDQKEYYKKLKCLRPQIKLSFSNTISGLQKVLGPIINIYPSLIAMLVYMKMQKILRAEQKLY